MFSTQFSKLKHQTIHKLLLFPLLAISLACPPERKPCKVVVSVLAVDTSTHNSPFFPEVVWETTSYDTTLLEELNGYADWKKSPDFFSTAGTIVELVYSDSSKMTYEMCPDCEPSFARYFGRERVMRYFPSGAALDQLREWRESIKLKEGWVFF